ncbi:DUF4190 domain-containing protein [Longispora sp. K20-0274]|uniref:DUF4190 domain-containing protein n=1 Tax=Longispora sp. K20-0274 TaxID=3088255 RepID=UPI00399C4714
MTYPHSQNDPYQQGAPQNPQDPLDFQVPTPYPDPYGYQQPYPPQQQQYAQPEQPYGYPAYQGYYQQPPLGPPKTNGLALAAMITSIVSLVIMVCSPILSLSGIVGAILGHVARKQIRERGERGAGQALAGIICGYIAFAIGLLMIGVLILAATGTFDDLHWR